MARDYSGRMYGEWAIVKKKDGYHIAQVTRNNRETVSIVRLSTAIPRKRLEDAKEELQAMLHSKRGIL